MPATKKSAQKLLLTIIQNNPTEPCEDGAFSSSKPGEAKVIYTGRGCCLQALLSPQIVPDGFALSVVLTKAHTVRCQAV